jgi:hypothetical protein
MDEQDFKSIGLTEKQLERQLKKIRDLVFNDYEAYPDGSYKGELIQDILSILQKNMPKEDEVSDIIYLKMVKDAALDVTEYILSSLKGIDTRLATFYSYDFTNQSYNSIYSVGLKAKAKDNDDDNPMYG